MKTLVLNSNGEPLSIISIRRAVVLSMKSDNMSVLAYYDKKMKLVSGEISVPAVMIYSKYIKIKRKKFPSKRAIRLRDKGQCGYCGQFLSPEDLTIDHIVPVSRFKEKSQANTWENQISCCWKCNNSKGNKTPQEAGMSMLFTPQKIDILFLLEKIPEEWSRYI
jgi:hypothetical protein